MSRWRAQSLNLRSVRVYCTPYLISGNVVFLTGTCFYCSNLFERPCIYHNAPIIPDILYNKQGIINSLRNHYLYKILFFVKLHRMQTTTPCLQKRVNGPLNESFLPEIWMDVSVAEYCTMISSVI